MEDDLKLSLSLKSLTYLYKYFRNDFFSYMGYVHEWEHTFNKLFWHPYTSEEVYNFVINGLVHKVVVEDLYES